jgi:alpha-tubulin suppressor-like RCC1 family protein
MGFRTPTRIEDRYFKLVQCGGQFSLLIDVEGQLMLWGSENGDSPPQLSVLQGLADKPVS